MSPAGWGGLLLLCAASAAAAGPEGEAPGPEEIPLRVRALDVSADTLPAGQGEFHLGWLAYHHGIVDGFQVSTHVATWLLTVANLTARVQLLDRPEMRLTLQAGGYWLLGGDVLRVAAALPAGSKLHLLAFPAELRTSIPLGARVELNLASKLTVQSATIASNGNDRSVLSGVFFGAEASLSRYDRRGSWHLIGALPFLSRQGIEASLGEESLVNGSLFLDDLSAWSVLLARDHVFGATTHTRLGMGWRGRPGIILLDGIGQFILQLDVYWR